MNKKIISFNELSDLTGLSKSYLYKLNSMGKIPSASKPLGKKLYFDKDSIENWLGQNPLFNAAESEIEANTRVTINQGKGGLKK